MIRMEDVTDIFELISDLTEIAGIGRHNPPSSITPLVVEMEEVNGVLTVMKIPGLVLVNGSVVVVRIRE